MERRISGTTRLLALFGSPVGHSGSPAMYNYSFEKLCLDYAYLAFDVTVDTVEKAVQAARTLNMRGFNITMPCKTEALKYMDELSPAARLIGAVNTVVQEDGKLYGHNTDGRGFVLNLSQHGVEVKGKKMTILGGGGAATAIFVQAALDGAKEISVFNVKDSFFAGIEATAAKLFKEAPGCAVKVCDLADEALLKAEIADSSLLVNATRVGMKPMDGESPVRDCSVFRKDLVVCDVVYNPKETKLMRDAAAAGCEKVIGGTGMLLWQGVEAFKLYTGKDMPVKEVQELYFS